jgi:hypothetical protein
MSHDAHDGGGGEPASDRRARRNGGGQRSHRVSEVRQIARHILKSETTVHDPSGPRNCNKSA